MRLDEILGIEYVELAPDHGVTRVRVGEEMLQPAGALHGGISAYLIENCAGSASVRGFEPGEAFPVGMSLEVNHLLPVFAGDTVETRARLVRGGGRTQVWSIEQVRLSDGEVFCVGTHTVYIKRVPKA